MNTKQKIIQLIYETIQDNHFGQDGKMYSMAQSVWEALIDNNCVCDKCYQEYQNSNNVRITPSGVSVESYNKDLVLKELEKIKIK